MGIAISTWPPGPSGLTGPCLKQLIIIMGTCRDCNPTYTVWTTQIRIGHAMRKCGNGPELSPINRTIWQGSLLFTKINSIVAIGYVSGKRRTWSDCADALAGPGLRCPHMSWIHQIYYVIYTCTFQSAVRALFSGHVSYRMRKLCFADYMIYWGILKYLGNFKLFKVSIS